MTRLNSKIMITAYMVSAWRKMDDICMGKASRGAA
jgi:hypothetical protein